MPDVDPRHIEAVTEAVSARLHETTDRWSFQQYRPAVSADTTSAEQAALGVLTSTDPAVLDAMQDALVRAGRLTEERAIDKPGRRGINPQRRLVTEWEPDQ